MLALSLTAYQLTTTYSEVAFRTTELAEVFIDSAHDDFLDLDLSAIAELHCQIGVSLFVESLTIVHVWSDVRLEVDLLGRIMLLTFRK